MRTAFALLVLTIAAMACSDSTGPLVSLDLTQVVVGGGHSCAISTAGTVYCWGRASAGQLGTGGTSHTPRPIAVSLERPFASVTAGYDHTCGVLRDGRAYCWGWNAWGQLGRGVGLTGVRNPNPVAGEHVFVTLAAGWYHTCGVTDDGTLLCWGYNGDGQLGTGDRVEREVPTPVADSAVFTAVAAGAAHTCATTEAGTVRCWGRNSEGQLGDGSSERRLVPVTISGGRKFQALTAGRAHTCGLTPGQAIYCWGANGNGQLGVNGVSAPGVPGTTVPARVAREQAYVRVSAGDDYTCAVDAAHVGYCWGRAEYGQLGIARADDQKKPYVIGRMLFRAIAAGPGTHTCGIDSGGRAFCWGDADHGGLGSTTTTYSPVPIPVDNS